MSAAQETKINLLLFPSVTQLDLTGPYEVLVRIPGARIELVGATMEPVKSDRGLAILPTTTRDRASKSDLLVVPGGPGTDDAILDPQWVGFVRNQAKTAQWILGICTGSLLLGAAGLLRGKRSGGHWLARDLLTQFGATVSDDRMVVDGNIFTSGGVTAGIDMALRVVAEIAGEEAAKRIQLQIEYDPEPPFRSGTPFTASAETVEAQRQAGAARRKIREAAVAKAAAALAAEPAK
ncbi:MAG: DJ-1/PfpI family protein [Xanthobacteraceae bacterium]